MPTKPSRRNFIRYGLGLSAASGLVLAGLAVPGFSRGFRFPVLQYEPGWASTHMDLGFAHVTAKEATVVQQNDGARLRACGLRPTIEINADHAATIDIEIENVHPEAQIAISGSNLSESGDGLTRRVTGTLSTSQPTRIDWRLREETGLRFAVIGDTGGNRELQWTVQRAQALGASFMIHLGDVYYGDTDSQTAPQILNRSELPVFTAIGNHDFHDGFDLVHRQFTDTIGPRNAIFNVGHIRFVNVDTAAATFPVASAERGELLSQLQQSGGDGANQTTIVFTHAPLSDPRPPLNGVPYSHTVPDMEIPWLREQLSAINTSVLLAGHIHLSAEIDEQGIECYIAGEGLAHHDLNYKRPVARMLLGTIEEGQRHSFQWQPLLMPADYHCSDRIKRILKSSNTVVDQPICSDPYSITKSPKLTAS